MKDMAGAIKAIVALVLGLVGWEIYCSLILSIMGGHPFILFFS